MQLELEQKVLLALRPWAPLEQPGLAQQELQALGQPGLPLAQPLLAWRLGMPREAS